MKKEVDPRINKAIKAAEKRHAASQRAAAKKREDEATKHKRYIASFSKAAKAWVDKHLFKLIGEAEASRHFANCPEAKRVHLYSNTPFIPGEALARAAEKIKGVRTFSEWVQSYHDPDGGYSEDAHYEYYATWSDQQ